MADDIPLGRQHGTACTHCGMETALVPALGRGFPFSNCRWEMSSFIFLPLSHLNWEGVPPVFSFGLNPYVTPE